MKIININIEEFGCLEDKRYNLSPEFNLAVGENESGKSTLLAFIKFIFYGLPKKTNDTAPERDRSFGWRSNTASGSLTFSDSGENIYTIYRRAVRKKGEKRESVSEECRIIDEKSGTEVHKGEDAGELFLGVPSSVFESTCFIKQMGVTDIRTADIGSALENILMSADETINLEKSLDRLESARKLLLHKKGNGGLLSDLEAEKEELSARLDKAKVNYSRILSITEAADRLRRDATEKRKELDKLEDLSAAVSKAETVKRFDTLRSKESELAKLKGELEAFRMSEASNEGFIPDTAYTSALEEALGGYLTAHGEYANASRVLTEAASALEAAQKTTLGKSPLTPDQIREKGGVERICRGFELELSAVEKKKKTGRSLSVASCAAFAISACLIALSFAISIPYLLYIGIGGAAISAILLATGLSSSTSAKKLAEKLDRDLDENGAPIHSANSVKGRIAIIRNTLSLCLGHESDLKALENRFASARSVSELRKNDLDTVEDKARRLISKWRTVSDTDTAKALRISIDASKAVTEECDRRSREIIGIKGQADALKNSLEGINEADLRARVSSAAIEIYESGKAEEITRRRRFVAESLRSTNEKTHETEKELVRLENESENPARLAVALEENRKKFDREKLRFDAIIMAQTALTEASGNIRNSVSPALRAKAEGYMAALTDKKYIDLGIDGDYALSAKSEASGVRSVELLSAGTKDSAYLSLRLALLEVIFGDERPFLALDEALAQLDDKRAAAALKLLASYCRSGGQCILFTCHSREEKLLDGIAKANVLHL